MIINKHHISSPTEVIQTKLDIPNNQLEQCIKEMCNSSGIEYHYSNTNMDIKEFWKTNLDHFHFRFKT